MKEILPAAIRRIKNPLLLFLIILFGWGFYRYFFHLPEWADELIFKPLIWLAPTIFLVKVVEKELLTTLGLSKKKFLKNCIVGILFGLLLSVEVILTKKFKYGSITFNPEGLTNPAIILAAALSLATGFAEELTFRGYIMTRLQRVMKSELLAIVLSTLLFVIVHLPNIIFVLKYSPYDSFTYGLVIFVAGAADAFIFARTGTLVAPTLSHAVWNFSTSMFK